MASSSDSAVTTGQNIVVAGLIVQLVLFGIFLAITILFHVRSAALSSPTYASTSHPQTSRPIWVAHLWTLYPISILIVTRALVRVVEFAQGHEGYIISHEWFLYVFDALMIWTAMAIMCFIFPGNVGVALRQVTSDASQEKVHGGFPVALPERSGSHV